MIYFALLNSGEIIKLGEHIDYDSADLFAEKACAGTENSPIWLIDQETAAQWVTALNS